MLKAALKKIIPRSVRLWRYWLADQVAFRALYAPAPMREFSDYDDYWEKRGNIKIILRRWKVAGELILRDARVLDVGCGSGEFLEYLKKVRPDVRGEGSDFSEKAVAMTTALGFKTRLLDITQQPIGETFDVITMFEVLEHLPEAEFAVRTLKAAFREQLILSMPNVGYIGCRCRLALFGRFPITMCVMHIKEHVRHWTPHDFREWVRHEKLKVVRIEGQYGPAYFPWKMFPGLFAKGLVYVVKHADEVPEREAV